jgi:hypothetical protein
MIDYNQRPAVPPDALARAANALTRWLPSRDDASVLSDWNRAEWLAAEWLAYWQNALPWLVARTAEAGAVIPGDIHDRLLAVDRASRARTAAMLDSAAELLDDLRRQGVEAMPLKGAALAPCYFPDPGLRPLADLDILIHPRDVAPAVATLLRLGYAYYSRSAEDEVYLRGERKAMVWAPDNVHPVELHYALREEYAGLSYELAPALWAASRDQPYWGGRQARLPDPPALLHHVCAHATSDWLIQRGKVMQIGDIQRIADRMSGEDWSAFAAGLPPSGARFVYPALAFTLKHAAAPVPAAVMDHLRRHTPRALRAWVEASQPADTSESNPASRSGIGFDIARLLARSPAERARMWLRSVFPRRRNLTKRYPRLAGSPAWPLGYLLLNLDRLRRLKAEKAAPRRLRPLDASPQRPASSDP